MVNNPVYNEVLEILNNIPIRDYLKIPHEYVQFLNNNKCNEYYKSSKNELSREAYKLFLKIYIDYIAEEYQKDKINEMLKLNEIMNERNKKNRYNPDEIFKKKSSICKKSNLVVIEEKWYRTILKRIREFWIRKQ